MDTVDIPPPGIDFFLNAGLSGAILDINIEIKIEGGIDTRGGSGQGPWVNNLDIVLTHLMTPVLIYDGGNFGFPTSRMDAIFDDEAAGASPKSGDVLGTFKPDEPLSAFDGFDLFGPWKLNISDSTPFPDEGEKLISWRIFGEYEPFQQQITRIPPPTTPWVPEPGSLALLALGAGAVYLRRRRA